MKKRNWISLVLVLLCLLLGVLYKSVVDLRADRTAPTIQIQEGIPQISVRDPEEVLLQGITATDDVDGDVTDSVLVESVLMKDKKGTVTVTYAAFDAAGNVTKAKRDLFYTDYKSPRFTLSQPLVMEQNRFTNLHSRIHVLDDLDGDISSRIHVHNLTGTSSNVLGTYQVRLSVTNSLGDTTQLELPVEVLETGTYDGVLELTDYLVYLPVGTEFDGESYLKRYTAGGTVQDLTQGVPSNCTLEITGSVDLQTPGVYELRYLLICPGIGRTYTGYTKLMVVVEG